MSKKQSSAAPRRQYDEQFKQEALKLAASPNRSVPDVAKSLGISPNILYRWRDLAQASKAQAPCQAEVAQLREQLRRTEQERDILKKALSIFSRQT